MFSVVINLQHKEAFVKYFVIFISIDALLGPQFSLVLPDFLNEILQPI